jgi:hypothetical protein
MSEWLDPVRASLDGRLSPVVIFIRDDDGGWRNDRLLALLETTYRHGVPVDVAMIPEACDMALARELRRADRAFVRFHQHGRSHCNHESAGRKCEFGLSRSAVEQRNDIAAGRRRLADVLGAHSEPIFTPPWNRCTPVTARCLVELGFELLSCDVSAHRFDVESLAELPVSLDWTGRRGAKAGLAPWGEAIAAAIRVADSPVGLMLHHAVMDDDDIRRLDGLLDLLTAHSAAYFDSMLPLGRSCTLRGVS